MDTNNAANLALKVHFILKSVLQTTIITLRVTPILPAISMVQLLKRDIKSSF